jgi:UDP-glucose 6-dehydrogenase
MLCKNKSKKKMMNRSIQKVETTEATLSQLKLNPNAMRASKVSQVNSLQKMIKT